MDAYPHDQEAALTRMLHTVLQNHLDRDRWPLEVAMFAALWMLASVCVHFAAMVGTPLALVLDDVRGFLKYRVRQLDTLPPLVFSDDLRTETEEEDAGMLAGPLYEALAQLASEAFLDQPTLIHVALNVHLGVLTSVVRALVASASWSLAEVDAFIDDVVHHDLTVYIQGLQQRGEPAHGHIRETRQGSAPARTAPPA